MLSESRKKSAVQLHELAFCIPTGTESGAGTAPVRTYTVQLYTLLSHRRSVRVRVHVCGTVQRTVRRVPEVAKCLPSSMRDRILYVLRPLAACRRAPRRLGRACGARLVDSSHSPLSTPLSPHRPVLSFALMRALTSWSPP